MHQEHPNSFLFVSGNEHNCSTPKPPESAVEKVQGNASLLLLTVMMGWRSVTRSQREVALYLGIESAGRNDAPHDVIRVPMLTLLLTKHKGDTVRLPFRPLPPGGTHHSGHRHQPQNVLLRTPLLRTPDFSQAVRFPPHDPYHYRPPRPEGHWRSPPHPASSWSRHPPMWGQPHQQQQQQQDRRRGPPPRHQLPRYTPDWNDPTQY